MGEIRIEPSLTPIEGKRVTEFRSRWWVSDVAHEEDHLRINDLLSRTLRSHEPLAHNLAMEHLERFHDVIEENQPLAVHKDIHFTVDHELRMEFYRREEEDSHG